MSKAIELPLYASKPQRRISGTDLIAVTMYASTDRTVREYAIFTADGESLGTVYYGKASRAIYRGSEYGHTSYSSLTTKRYGSLADAALALPKSMGYADAKDEPISKEA